jgi:hypothetical protein
MSTPLPDPGDPLGIDVMLDATGDFVITGAGCLAICAGPENCIQALTLRMRTSRGDLMLHPDYGSQFNETVGHKDDPVLMLGVATADLANLIATDRRFIGVGNVNVAPHETQRGLVYTVSCDVYLTTDASIEVASLADPRVSSVIDPTYTDVEPYAIDPLDVPLSGDPLDFTTIGQQEYDTLADIDATQSMLNPQ